MRSWWTRLNVDAAQPPISSLPGWRWGCAISVYACGLGFFALLASLLSGYYDPADVVRYALFVLVGPTVAVAITSANRGRRVLGRAALALSAVLVVGTCVVANDQGPSASRAQLEAVHLPASLEFTYATENTALSDVGVYFTRNYVYRGQQPVALVHAIAGAFREAGFGHPTINDEPSELEQYGTGLYAYAYRGETLLQAWIEPRTDGAYAVTVTLEP